MFQAAASRLEREDEAAPSAIPCPERLLGPRRPQAPHPGGLSGVLKMIKIRFCAYSYLDI